MRSQRQYMNNF